MIIFSLSETTKTGLTTEDAEYLRRRLLTSRSVSSERLGSIGEAASMMYEASKTMLTVVELLIPVVEESMRKITHVEVAIDDGKDDDGQRVVDPSARVIIRSPDSPNAQQFRGELSFVSHRCTTGPLAWQYTYCERYQIIDPRIEDPDDRIIVEYTTSHDLNQNGVLAYSENFPMPSVYHQTMRDMVFGCTSTDSWEDDR